MKYYYTEDGSLLTGWQTIEENRYYFAADGGMLTGWQEIDGGKYWLGDSGALSTGWQEVEGKKLYFREDGTLATGDVTIDETLYHFAEDGTPWSWAWHRVTIPACTYSENREISIALMADANVNCACSLYKIDCSFKKPQN